MRLLLLTLLLPGVLCAGNVIYNSSFELGSNGFQAYNYFPLDKFDWQNSYTAELSRVVTESGAPHGARVLEILPPPNGGVEMVSAELKLKPDTEYTLSFYAKTSNSQHVGIRFSCRQNDNGKMLDYRIDRGVAVSAGDTWKRYSILFRTKPAPACYYNLCWNVKKSIKLDAVQFESGTAATAYFPTSPVELAVDGAKRTVAGEMQSSAAIKAISYDRDIPNYRAELHQKDVLTEKNDINILTFDLKKGIPATSAITVPLPRFTMYLLQVLGPEFNPSTGATDTFLRYHQPDWNDNGNFRIGLNVGFYGRGTPGSINSNLGTREEIGQQTFYWGNFHRHHSSKVSSWANLEPQEGNYQFSRLLPAASEGRKYKFGLSYCITGNWNFDNPPWRAKYDRRGKDAPVIDKKGSSRKTFLPELLLWRKYVRTFAETMKGKIIYFDVMNEPNVAFSPETYLEYLKAAYEEIKKVDPNIQVMGLSATEDLGCGASDFIEGVLAAGGGNYFDILTFHPYGTRQDDSPVPAQKRIREFFQIMKKYEVNKPLMNDECFYLNTKPNTAYQLEGTLKPGAASRRALIDMGEGLWGCTTLSMGQLYWDYTNPHRLQQTWDAKVTPNLLAVEQNAITHFLANAKPVSTLELPGSIIGYAFENKGRQFAALWSVTGDSATLTLPSDEVTVYDLFGNAITPKLSKIKIDRVPKYFQWKSISAKQGAEMLKNAELALNNPVGLGPVRMTSSGIVLELFNYDSKPISGFVRINSCMLENGGASTKFHDIPAGKSTLVTIPAKWNAQISGTVNLHFAIAVNGKIVPFSRSVPVTPLLTLANGEKSSSIPLERLLGGTMPEKSDCNAFFTLMRQEKVVTITVYVTDDHPGKNTPAPWSEDTVEFFLDLEPFRGDAKHPELYGKSSFQFALSPYRENPLFLLNKAVIPGLKTSVSIRKNGYVAQISFPVPGNAFAMEIAVDDSDSDKRKSQIGWCGTAQNYANRSTWAIVEMK